MLRTSLLLFAFSIASRNCAIIPDIPNSGNVGFRLDYDHRDAQFGEGIRDWFRNMKNKLGFGKKDTSKQVELPNPVDLDSISKLKLYQSIEAPPERLVIQPGNFFLDLSNLKFDPNKDWGFRVSNWYIIRRAPTTEEPFISKPVEEWAKWNEFSSADPMENVIKHGLEDKAQQKTTESSSFMSTMTSRAMMLGPRTTTSIPETTTPRTTTSGPETTTMKKEKMTNGERKDSSENAIVVMPVQDLSVEILTPTA